MTIYNFNTDGMATIYTHAQLGDTFTAPTGAREAEQTFKVTNIYGDQEGIKFGIVTGTIIKKDGELGKRKMQLKQQFNSSIGGTGLDYAFTNR